MCVHVMGVESVNNKQMYVIFEYLRLMWYETFPMRLAHRLSG